MSFIYMNRDLKFLSTSTSQTHTGTKLNAHWVEKDEAEAFRSANFKAELKLRDRNYYSEISSAVVSVFEARIERKVTILKKG